MPIIPPRPSFHPSNTNVKVKLLPTRAGTGRRGRPINPDRTDADRSMDKRLPEPKILVGHVPPQPRTLQREGTYRWVQLCKILIDKDILCPDFYPALEQICRLYDQLHIIEATIGHDIIVQGHAKQPRPNPLIKERTALMGLIRSCLCDFGLTAGSARSANVPVKGGKGNPDVASANIEGNPWDEEFQGS